MTDYFGSNTGDTLAGGAENDFIDVGGGGEPYEHTDDDVATGGDGDDTIIRLQNGDSADGGSGTDKAQVWLASEWINWVAGSVLQQYNHLGLNVDLTQASGSGSLFLGSGGIAGGGVTLTSIEVYDVTFGSGNDTAWGGDGDDRLVGEAYSFDLYTPENLGYDELHGRGGNDTIDGMVAVDYLYGDDGNDTIDGGVLSNNGGFDDYAGDFMYGGNGNDTITIRALDYADGGADNDTVALFALSAGVVDLAITVAQNIGTGLATIVGFENVVGSYYTDTIYGNAQDNVLDGSHGGDDEIHGRSGNDTIYGGYFGLNRLYGDGDNDTIYGHSGNDYIDGGTGNDNLYGQGGNDTYIVDSNLDVVSEADLTYGWDMGGLDEVRSSVTYTAGQYIEDVTLTGGLAINATGNDAGNTLKGNGAINTLSGLGGNDILTGRGGADVLYGGAGDDTYYVDSGAVVTSEQTVVGIDDGGVDTVISSVNRALATYIENLTLSGTAAINGAGNSAANTLLGNTAANTLSGNNGDDILNGRGGADTMYGGRGNDTYYVDESGDVTSEQVVPGVDDGGTDTVFSSVTRTLDLYIENLNLTGTGALNGTGNGGDNVINGNSAVNTLSGLGGNDVLDGKGAADTMYGGAGNDTYYVGTTGDVTSETTVAGVDDGGADTVVSTVTRTLGDFLENLTLSGSAAINGTGNTLDNGLTGNDAVNTLRGLGGNDSLDGGLGADVLYGGSGNDTYTVDDAGDVTSEQTVLGVDDGGVDTVISTATRILDLYLENLTLGGTAAINGTGNGVDNVINGNNAVNTLYGLGGNDTLDGKGGADTMYGGAGNDTYYVNAGSDVTSEQTVVGVDDGGIDTVISTVNRVLGTYFENLTLSGTAAISGTGNSAANTIIGNGADNVLRGGGSADIVTGGGGADTFAFNRYGNPNGVDHLTDFVSGTDKLSFTGTDYGFAAGHVLAGTEISFTGAAVGATAQFVYNAADNSLGWDSNGAGAGGYTMLCYFDNLAAPVIGDFVFT